MDEIDGDLDESQVRFHNIFSFSDS
jgi:hypothetical protein